MKTRSNNYNSSSNQSFIKSFNMSKHHFWNVVSASSNNSNIAVKHKRSAMNSLPSRCCPSSLHHRTNIFKPIMFTVIGLWSMMMLVTIMLDENPSSTPFYQLIMPMVHANPMVTIGGRFSDDGSIISLASSIEPTSDNQPSTLINDEFIMQLDDSINQPQQIRQQRMQLDDIEEEEQSQQPALAHNIIPPPSRVTYPVSTTVQPDIQSNNEDDVIGFAQDKITERNSNEDNNNYDDASSTNSMMAIVATPVRNIVIPNLDVSQQQMLSDDSTQPLTSSTSSASSSNHQPNSHHPKHHHSSIATSSSSSAASASSASSATSGSATTASTSTSAAATAASSSSTFMNNMMMMATQNTTENVYRLVPEECVYVRTEEGIYIVSGFNVQRNESDSMVCGLYMIASPTQIIEIEFLQFDVSCHNGGLLTVLDGWEMKGQFFPSPEDHPIPRDARFHEFCGQVRPKKVFRMSQNVGLIEYRIPTSKQGFTVRVRYIDNPKPCNTVIDGLDFGIYSIRNFGRRVNCSTYIMFGSKLNILSLNVGQSYRRLDSIFHTPRNFIVETGVVKKCKKRGVNDYVEFRGGHGLDTQLMQVGEDICGFRPFPYKKHFTILCTFSAVRMVSSGQYDNHIEFSYEPMIEMEQEQSFNAHLTCLPHH